MRAVYYEKNGAANEVLHVADVDTPQPGPGEVRVRLKTSGVNPSDVKTRAGTARKIAFPRVIPHSDGAGEIDAVGEGVAKSRIGERVWTWNGQWKRAFGTAAEYIVLSEIQAVKLPDSVSFEVGACLGIPALTAWHAIDIAGTRSGMTLLIAGGAGAVAHYAIQFAKARGAFVLTTVSSPEKAKLALEAGADVAIDRKTEDVGARVMALTKGGVDAVIELDLTANAALLPATLRPRGTLVVYGTGPQVQFPGSFCLVNNITVKFLLVYELTEDERARAVDGVTRMLDTIGRTPDRSSLLGNAHLPYPLFSINRGGQATYHGPGQLMGYPIIDLRGCGQDLHKYLRWLEQLVIDLLARYDVAAQRRESLTGVWVENRKISSIGVGVRHWITMHGFALNVCGDLSPFDHIVPCGINNVAMTSMEKETKKSFTLAEVARTLEKLALDSIVSLRVAPETQLTNAIAI